MTTQISQQEIQQTAVRLGIPLDAEWAEKGGWYLNGIAVPTALVPQISAFRQDEKRIAVTGHRDIDKRTVDAAKWWIDKIAVKYSNATIITGGALGTEMFPSVTDDWRTHPRPLPRGELFAGLTELLSCDPCNQSRFAIKGLPAV